MYYFICIDAKLIKGSTLSTSGAAGPSGLDVKDWKRMCTSFKSVSDDLCHVLSEVAKRLCTVYVDPSSTDFLSLDRFG